MNLLDTLLGALGGAPGQSATPQPANPLLQIALQLLAGGAGAGGGQGTGAAGPGSLAGLGGLLGGLGGLGGPSGAGGGPTGPQQGAGGLGDLMAAFERNGMGDLMGSWIGSGPNLPIAPDQLQQALGGDVLGGLAKQAGLSSADASAGLAELLPQLIDRLTPQGQLPSNGLGELGSIIEALSARRG
jgi:uncharacterized protein YidB (DUF937 family)